MGNLIKMHIDLIFIWYTYSTKFIDMEERLYKRSITFQEKLVYGG